MLEIGHEYPEGGAIVELDSPFVTQTQWQNRQLLYVGATLHNVAVYPGEDWHISYGDNLDAVVRRKDYAKYGPIKNFDILSGVVTDVYRGEEIDRSYEF